MSFFIVILYYLFFFASFVALYNLAVLFSIHIYPFIQVHVQYFTSCLSPIGGLGRVGSKLSQDSYLHSVSQFMQNTDFFPS